MSLRLFSRAPTTRIRSWLSATSIAGDCVPVLAAILIPFPRLRRGRPRGRGAPPRAQAISSVLNQPEDVAIGVGESGHKAAATNIARKLLHGSAGGGDLGQLRLAAPAVPVGHWPRHPPPPAARRHPASLAPALDSPSP